jgi:hypothetical protein
MVPNSMRARQVVSDVYISNISQAFIQQQMLLFVVVVVVVVVVV